MAQMTFTHMDVSNERWTNSRWKPTVIPSAVRTYIPSNRPRSVQPNPQPHKKKGATITPTSGTVMAMSVTTCVTSDARLGTALTGGEKAEAATGAFTSSDTTKLLSGLTTPGRR